MRVSLVSYNARSGDAIGNQVAEKLEFFLDRGADVRVFVEDGNSIHCSLRPHTRLLDTLTPRGEGWAFLSTSDLVIIEYGQAYSLLELLPMLAGGKPRVVLDYHGITPLELWGEHQREALAKGLKRRGLVWCVDAAIVHSRFTRRELLDHSDFPGDLVHALGHVVSAEPRSVNASSKDFRASLGIGPARILLFVGRLAPNKRVPVLVEAVALLKNQTPPVHAVVIGDSTDTYESEADRCRQLSVDLGVADRVHILGHLPTERVRDAYRSADVFVMPSRHEGFCIPVIEAMAHGLPVVAARAGALPETISGAGLTFIPDDVIDLARQIKRIVPEEPPETRVAQPASVSHDRERAVAVPSPFPPRAHRQDTTVKSYSPLRIAIVSGRYGSDFVGGAETSLRSIAEALCRAGHTVEVFATCARSESAWNDQTPAGASTVADVPVHRFRIDARDQAKYLEALLLLPRTGSIGSLEAERDYLTHSLRSTDLLEELRRRIESIDVILVGPYALGLTHAVATAFAEKTVLLPCFHDEPLARLAAWRETYRNVAGILYHSTEERDLAERKLGIEHPGAGCCGAYVDTDTRGAAQRGRELVGTDQPYLVYCGRYVMQKGLPALIEAARAYDQAHPGRFVFVFMGEGNVAIPQESWARDLGFVDETTKRDVLAGAAALVQLSRFESLSLVALEAWAQSTPVLGNQQCPVLVGHIQRGGGGWIVDGAGSLASTFDKIASDPEQARIRGEKGRNYVRTHYGVCSTFVGRLVCLLREAGLPLAERLRRRGMERAGRFDRGEWRRQFGEIVERVLDNPSRPHRGCLTIHHRVKQQTVAVGTGTVLVPVLVSNHGTHAAIGEGCAGYQLRAMMHDSSGRPFASESQALPLPELLMPGKTLTTAVPVSVPTNTGVYHVTFRADRTSWLESDSLQHPMSDRTNICARPTAEYQNSHSAVRPDLTVPAAGFTLIVEDAATRGCLENHDALLETARAALAEAREIRRLPESYTDVTHGLLARCKRWIKHKILNNFKRAYVDVLSRQQSSFNEHLCSAVNELTLCCAALDHVRESRNKPIAPTVSFGRDESSAATNSAPLQDLVRGLAESQDRCQKLEARLARIEAIVEVSRRD